MEEIWLSIDLSWSTGSVAIHRSGKLVFESELEGFNKHCEELIPAIDSALRNAGVGLSAIDRHIVSAGPGSYTGLRIAMASAKALALTYKKPIETISSSEARARAWLKRSPEAYQNVNEMLVLTRVSSTRYHISRFQLAGSELLPKNEEVVEDLLATEKTGLWLLDMDTKAELLPKDILSFRFPSKATFLGECLMEAKTRATAVSPSDLIRLSPHYFGSGRFD